MEPRDLELFDRLCELSRARAVPFGTAVASWPAARDPDAWYTSPELVSLYGTHAGQQLSPEQLRELAFFEAVNFCSLNIYGERFLLEGLSSRLHRRDHAATSDYLQHFLDEENKHLFYFATFCRRFAGKIYSHAVVAFPREHAPGEEDFLFFAKALCFEEVVDYYNRRMASDVRLAPIAREINRMHHLEETRHLAFGRSIVRALFVKHSPSWSIEIRARVRDALLGFLAATWRQYYNPETYRDAGLADPFALAEAAFDDEAARAHRARVSRRCLTTLHEIGALEREDLS